MVDADTLTLTLISGLAGAILGAIVGGWISGRYAIDAVRRQSLRSVRQDAYARILRYLHEIEDLTKALAQVSKVNEEHVKDVDTAAEQVTAALSPLSGLLSEDAYSKALNVADAERAGSADMDALKRFVRKAKQQSGLAIRHRLSQLLYQFKNDTSDFKLCDPPPGVETALTSAQNSLTAVLNLRALIEPVAETPGFDLNWGPLDDRIAHAQAAIQALRDKMVADLRATLG
ncbi:MAG TPA: hypothetical protein VEY12_11055 [Thermoplasmata archaeon]|nr:hypothetical protein [Thermoplasmata archaeon]